MIVDAGVELGKDVGKQVKISVNLFALRCSLLLVVVKDLDQVGLYVLALDQSDHLLKVIPEDIIYEGIAKLLDVDLHGVLKVDLSLLACKTKR